MNADANANLSASCTEPAFRELDPAELPQIEGGDTATPEQGQQIKNALNWWDSLTPQQLTALHLAVPPSQK